MGAMESTIQKAAGRKKSLTVKELAQQMLKFGIHVNHETHRAKQQSITEVKSRFLGHLKGLSKQIQKESVIPENDAPDSKAAGGCLKIHPTSKDPSKVADKTK